MMKKVVFSQMKKADVYNKDSDDEDEEIDEIQ